jgi:hypothetical protein
MIPLFLLSIFFVMLVIVYLMTIRRGAEISAVMATADALLRSAIIWDCSRPSPRREAIARVIARYWILQPRIERRFATGSRDRRDGRTRVAASLNNRVIYLADIGMIAPLLGLLVRFWSHPCVWRAWPHRSERRYVALSGELVRHWLTQPLVGHRYSGDDVLRIFPRQSRFQFGSCHHARFGSAFPRYGKRTERTPVLIEDEL